MAISIKHKFQSEKADGDDDSLVQPSNWNDEHNITLGSGNLIGRTTAGAGAAEEVPIASFSEFNSATPARIYGTGSVWGDLAVLTDASTISVNLNNGYDFGGAGNAPLAIGGNRTLGAPSGARTGKKGILWFGASGSTRTLTLHASWLLCEGVEEGPYSITTSQTLGIAYACVGGSTYVTGILRRG